MTAQTTSTSDAGRALKAKHRAVWAFGDYPAVATDLVSSLGPILVQACQVRPGDRVLDVAAGSGNAAIPAAEAGASVVATSSTRSPGRTWHAPTRIGPRLDTRSVATAG